MLRRSWETKRNIIKELNNRLNENRIISEAKEYKYPNNWENLDVLNNKLDNFLYSETSEEFVNSFSKDVLDIYFNIKRSSCGPGTNDKRFIKSFNQIKSKEELIELNSAIKEKPLCYGGAYKSLDDVLNGEFSGAVFYGREDVKILENLSSILTNKGIGSILFTRLVNPGFKNDPYGVKEDSIEIKVGVKVEPNIEEKEEPETDETEKEEKIEKKKGYKKVDSIGTLEDIITKKKIIKKGNSGGIVEVIQKSLLDLKYDIGGTEPDGKFGPKTKSAVMKFQGDNNLTVDGIVGPKTAQKIIDKLPSELEKLLTNDQIEEIKEKTKTTLKDDNLSPEQKQNKIENDLKKAGVNINLDTDIDFSNLTKLKEPKQIEKKVNLVFNKFGTIPVGEYNKNLQSESEISKPILDMMKRMNIIK